MRVISGTFKGKKIQEPKNKLTRPLRDLTKESIFNIISHSKKFNANLIGANILDLFSGVGSFGIECLSRGAKRVVFIENYEAVLPVLEKNLFNLKSANNYEIIKKNIYDKKTFSNITEKFDIIFLDPPFKDKNMSIILNFIVEENIINSSGIIIIHRHKDEEEIFPHNLNVVEKKIYGKSKIFFFTG